MGNTLSTATAYLIVGLPLLTSAYLTSSFYHGGLVAGKGILLTTGVEVLVSQALLKALIIALALVVAAVAVVIVVMSLRFVIYKIKDGVIYMCEQFGCWSEKEKKEHLDDAEQEAMKQRPDIFGQPTRPAELWKKMFTQLSEVLGLYASPNIAQQISELKSKCNFDSMSPDTLALTKAMTKLLLTLKSKINSPNGDASGDLLICAWEMFRTAFQEIFRCIDIGLVSAMPGTEVTIGIFCLFDQVFRLSASLNHRNNVATYNDKDEGTRCPTDIRKHVHKPIYFPGNIYFTLNVRLSALLGIGYFYRKINEIDVNYDKSGVVYLFKCKHCQLKVGNTNFYVGITKSVLSNRLSGHRSSIKCNANKSVAIHINHPQKGHNRKDIAVTDCLFDNYQVNILFHKIGAQAERLRPQEVFYQWLIGSPNIINKR